MILAEPIAVALQVGAALDTLGVAWLIGGSAASSLHGIPRVKCLPAGEAVQRLQEWGYA